MSIFTSKPKKYVRKPESGWTPQFWASKIPFRNVSNFKEVFRAVWENRDNLPYAWRILNHGVCDGCALGTSGLKDWTIEGIHLCNVRLRLLRLNTIPPLEKNILADVKPLQAMRSRDLRQLGRLSQPMIRRHGDKGFTAIGWDDAIDLIASQVQDLHPDETYYYLTSRGVPNETYYAVQKAVRAMGTNNIDNAARICHSPSTFAIKDALGVAATTCSYTDMIGTDVVTFFGSNVANNQPVVMKYLYHAKKAGTKVVSVNTYREPAMDEYWIPSDIESAIFGTKVVDHFYQVRAQGDMAFIHGTVKAIIEQNAYDNEFVSNHTENFDDFKTFLADITWEELERNSGSTQADMQSYANLLANAKNAVFVWGMGITQHTSGEDNVHAIINLALMKGFVGREGCGVMPIRGHSGVQGGAEMGAYATVLPGGRAINEENIAQLSAQLGIEIPASTGLTTPEMLDSAFDGKIKMLFAVGGNFREVMPNPKRIDKALAQIPLRVHMDITLSSQMLLEPSDTVLLLPAKTRYEVEGGVTQTSTERRVMYSPYIKGKHPKQARSEWDVITAIAAKVKPDYADKVRFASTQAIRDEIAEVIPFYKGIENLKQEGDQFQYGGAMLCDNWTFPTPSGKARFKGTALPSISLEADEFTIVTRRGKQFNSMVNEDIDTANNLPRNAIIVNSTDAKRLGFSDGDMVELSNDIGVYIGKLFISDVARQTIQVYWPEGNVLLDGGKRSPLAKIPAYKSGKARLAHKTSESVESERINV